MTKIRVINLLVTYTLLSNGIMARSFVGSTKKALRKSCSAFKLSHYFNYLLSQKTLGKKLPRSFPPSTVPTSIIGVVFLPTLRSTI